MKVPDFLKTRPWLRQKYFQWKQLRRVPFRSKWLVGFDLFGNSYWEFKNYNVPGRLRRKVEYISGSHHLNEFKPTPQWVQWLRYTRLTPPTLEELRADVQRQERIKILAMQANQRWNQVSLKSSDQQSDPRLGSAWGAPQQLQSEDATKEPKPLAAKVMDELERRETETKQHEMIRARAHARPKADAPETDSKTAPTPDSKTAPPPDSKTAKATDSAQDDRQAAFFKPGR